MQRKPTFGVWQTRVVTGRATLNSIADIFNAQRISKTMDFEYFVIFSDEISVSLQKECQRLKMHRKA